MKNFDRLKEMINKNADCFAEIKEINTGLEGIADLTLSNKVAVYYGWRELYCLGIFSNGEAVYKYADMLTPIQKAVYGGN